MFFFYLICLRQVYNTGLPKFLQKVGTAPIGVKERQCTLTSFYFIASRVRKNYLILKMSIALFNPFCEPEEFKLFA